MSAVSTFHLVERAPTVDEYYALRTGVGWGTADREATAHSIQHTLYWVVVLEGEQVIGCGRVIGDGGICFYVQDIIVLPAYQGLGLGRQIMDKVMAYLKAHLRPGAFAGLMAAKGVAGFYVKYGFIERPTEALGPGMIRFWR